MSTVKQLPATSKDNAVRHLTRAIAEGHHWYIGLLEAMQVWTDTEEVHDGRYYRYLIAGEAFDWLLLAERICTAVDELVPEDEKAALLFQGRPPLKLNQLKFKELLGPIRYHQYLNYFYGIAVEEALILAVQEEVRKERWTAGLTREIDLSPEVYRRLYGATRAELLRHFRREKDLPQVRSTSLAELKEFTYWLFKHRLEQSDKARIASDTKKGLERLRQLGTANGFSPDSVIEGLALSVAEGE